LVGACVWPLILGVGLGRAGGGGPAVPGPPPAAGAPPHDFTENGELGTKATYDSDSQQVLVSFAEELEEGQALYINVSRGNLDDPYYAEKNCGLVAEAPIAIFGVGQADKTAVSANAREAHGSRAVYRLPLEDESLLVQAYNDESLPPGESWGEGDLTPAKQAVLERGVDTFIDICVTDNGKVLRRDQIDFFYAMDLNNPHLVRDAMAADALGGAEAADGFDHNQARATSPQKYGELCVAAMGEIPFFRNKTQVGTDDVTGRPKYTYDTWDCRDSVHIPMTVTTGEPGSETVEGPQLDESNGGSGNKCDNRQYIYSLCEQDPRVISAVNEQGTQWVLLCRKGRGETPKLEHQGWDDDGYPIMVDTRDRSELTTHYNDLAMLGNNPVTGRTCFFQNALYNKTAGDKVPHPADVEKWDTIWKGVHGAEGGINCNNCHDSDPFVLSPWIRGAKRNADYDRAQQIMSGELEDIAGNKSAANAWVADAGSKAGTPVVPMMGVNPAIPMSDNQQPYTLVNYLSQGWNHKKQLVGPEVKGCNKCHRVGSGNMLKKWATRSVGLDTTYNKMITDAYLNNWERSHFMPLDPRDDADPNNKLPSETEWESSEYYTAIQHIIACKNANQNDDDPNAQCKFTDIPREAQGIDPGETGDCWSDIPDDCDY
jgi:hypothetical protein